MRGLRALADTIDATRLAASRQPAALPSIGRSAPLRVSLAAIAKDVPTASRRPEDTTTLPPKVSPHADVFKDNKLTPL